MQVKSPAEITRSTLTIGKNKAEMPLWKLTVQSAQAGAYIAFGGVLSVIIGYGFPGLTAENPALQRLLSGMVFPIGLILVVVLGAELFTGNNALLVPAVMRKECSAWQMMRNWGVVYGGNFVGALLFAWLLVYATGLTACAPYHEAVVKMAVAKTSMSWGVCFLKGVGANWCVCLAVWLALAGHTLTEKALGCFLPVMAFVALGYEHCIANMFFIPLGMMEGADVAAWDFVWRNLVPATAGNIAGGALLVGCVNAYVHLREGQK
ncbi:MAG: formate/nitrite transporter family protein [Firmicutes bacterium]|nr:formate/nitrite transporter family protein [Bacillota bacterium]MCM1401981.1 formate/nitrite transporter family protein [Bacteroides sp.]MCM1477177.1 formate/nitrite transporter family protein [Bacteroides sp.]